MAKIGTAHVEIKPVLNEEALEEITARIERAVRDGVAAGIAAARPAVTNVHVSAPEGIDAEAILKLARRESEKKRR